VLQSRVLPGDLFDTSDPESAAFRSRLAESIARLSQEGIWIGGSSWKYEGWLGQIYTRSHYLSRGRFSKKVFEAECLREYSEVFSTVCGDFAFYQFPSESFWQKLFAQVPAGFRFALKIPEQITCKVFPSHPRYGAQGGLANPSFLDAYLLMTAFLTPLEIYHEKVAALIFEFGAFPDGSFSDVREFVELLDPFLTALPRRFRYAVEIRNEEFLAPEYFECLRSHGVAHVFNAWARMPELQDQMAMRGAFTADFIVSRALLRRGRPYAEAVRLFAPYTKIQDPDPETRAALRELIERAREARREAYIYVNNRLEGNSPGTIQAVIDPVG
jgi:uncharacterized protein YecE (DUF72 family)